MQPIKWTVFDTIAHHHYSLHDKLLVPICQSQSGLDGNDVKTINPALH